MSAYRNQIDSALCRIEEASADLARALRTDDFGMARDAIDQITSDGSLLEDLVADVEREERP